MVAEVFAGFSAAKAAFDIAKGLKNLDDRTRRNEAIIELQEQILATQTEQAAAIDKIRNLEKQVADFETWDTEKKRYELKEVGLPAFAYMLKPEARGSEPPHFICTNCYAKRSISIIQHGPPKPGARIEFFCPDCCVILLPGSEAFANGAIRWID